MTLILKDIPHMTSEEASLLLNSMMSDFSKVRLQVANNQEDATNILLQEGEIVDKVVDMLFKRINNNNLSIENELKALSEQATNVDIKAYHALSHDDGNVELNLKASIDDITAVNKKFVDFIKNKKNGDDEAYLQSKKNFISQTNDIKSKYAKFEYKNVKSANLHDNINKSISQRVEFNDLVTKEESFRKNNKSNMIPQMLTAIAIATATSKFFNFVRSSLKKDKKK